MQKKCYMYFVSGEDSDSVTQKAIVWPQLVKVIELCKGKGGYY